MAPRSARLAADSSAPKIDIPIATRPKSAGIKRRGRMMVLTRPIETTDLVRYVYTIIPIARIARRSAVASMLYYEANTRRDPLAEHCHRDSDYETGWKKSLG